MVLENSTQLLQQSRDYEYVPTVPAYLSDLLKAIYLELAIVVAS